MKDWRKTAKAVLRAEMARKQVSYTDLMSLLNADGGKETEANLRNKVSRGSFTAAFFLQCLTVMKVTTLHLEIS